MTNKPHRLHALIDERVADALANERGAVCVSLLSAATAFAQLDQRLATMDANIDQRIKAALDREQRERCAATADVVRSVLAEFIAEFRRVCSEVEAKLAHVETLLAQRPPLDQSARNERPN